MSRYNSPTVMIRYHRMNSIYFLPTLCITKELRAYVPERYSSVQYYSIGFKFLAMYFGLTFYRR